MCSKAVWPQVSGIEDVLTQKGIPLQFYCSTEFLSDVLHDDCSARVISCHRHVTHCRLLAHLLKATPRRKRGPKSQYGGRGVFNLLTQFSRRYQETTLAIGLISVQNKRKMNCYNLENNWKLTYRLPPYLCQITGYQYNNSWSAWLKLK